MSRRLSVGDLCDAAASGDVATVSACLEAGIPVDSKDGLGRTALHLASQAGKIDTANLLLDRGASVDAQDTYGATALHLASLEGKADTANLLLDRGASVDAQNNFGRTALHLASLEGKADTANLLLDSGASVDAQDTSGRTPLMKASLGGHHNVVTVLLNHGASVNLQDQDGDTALINACKRGREECAQLLLNANTDVNIRNKDGQTALTVSSGKLKEIILAHIAAQKSHIRDTPRGKGGSSAPSERQEASQQMRRENQLQEQVQLQQTQTNTLQQQLDAAQQRIQEIGQALLHTQQQHQLLQQENLQLRQQLRTTETQLQARLQHSHLTEFWEVPREDVTLNMHRILGTGAWGFVVEGQFRGQKVAVKCLHDLIRQPAFIRLIRQEISIMAQLRHPNLVMLIAAVIGEEEDPLIVTELLDTSLRRAYERGRLEGSSKLGIFRDIASALNYLHLHHHGPIIHRDVSSANVLLEAKPNNQWKAKLSDFGSAKLVREAMTTAPGAVVYSAPEVRTQTGIPQSSKLDVYSYGVLMCEVTVNEFPSEERFPSMVRIASERWPLIHTLITACIQQHPSNRPHMAYILGELDRVLQH